MFEKLEMPWWGTLSLLAGGTLVSMFGPDAAPEGFATAATIVGAAMIVIGILSALPGHLIKRSRRQMGIFLFVISGVLLISSFLVGVIAYNFVTTGGVESATAAKNSSSSSKSIKSPSEIGKRITFIDEVLAIINNEVAELSQISNEATVVLEYQEGDAKAKFEKLTDLLSQYGAQLKPVKQQLSTILYKNEQYGDLHSEISVLTAELSNKSSGVYSAIDWACRMIRIPDDPTTYSLGNARHEIIELSRTVEEFNQWYNKARQSLIDKRQAEASGA